MKEYSETFWERLDELNDGERYEQQILKGEQRIERRKTVKLALEAKIAKYKAPNYQLRLQYGANKVKSFSEEEDRLVFFVFFIL